MLSPKRDFTNGRRFVESRFKKANLKTPKNENMNKRNTKNFQTSSALDKNDALDDDSHEDKRRNTVFTFYQEFDSKNMSSNKNSSAKRLVHHPGEKLKDDHVLIPISKETIEKYQKLSLKQLPISAQHMYQIQVNMMNSQDEK